MFHVVQHTSLFDKEQVHMKHALLVSFVQACQIAGLHAVCAK